VRKQFPRDIDGTNIGYTGENTERYAVMEPVLTTDLTLPIKLEEILKKRSTWGSSQIPYISKNYLPL
jgi:hypothetical protein